LSLLISKPVELLCGVPYTALLTSACARGVAADAVGEEAARALPGARRRRAVGELRDALAGRRVAAVRRGAIAVDGARGASSCPRLERERHVEAEADAGDRADDQDRGERRRVRRALARVGPSRAPV